MLALESPRKRSVMQSKAGSDVLFQFQSTDVMVNWIHMPVPTRNELARRWHSIVIGENEYWLILFQVLLQPEAVARGAGDTTGYVAWSHVLAVLTKNCQWLVMLQCPRAQTRKAGLGASHGAALSWGSPVFQAGLPGCQGCKMGTLGPSVWLRRRVGIKGWVLLWVVEMGGCKNWKKFFMEGRKYL